MHRLALKAANTETFRARARVYGLVVEICMLSTDLSNNQVP